MRELELTLVERALLEMRRPGRRSQTRDQKSWARGASRGNGSRWLDKKLPPINPDDPWSMDLTPTEE